MTWLLAAACVAVLVRLTMRPADDAVAIVTALAVVPARVTASGWVGGELATLVTSCFLHAGWVHLGGNLLYLLVFGPAVEARLGHVRFLATYLACGMLGAATHVWAYPQSTAPLVGASGAIAGVLGAHLVLEPRTRVTTLVPAIVIVEVASLPAAFVVAVWFLGQLASGLAPVAPGAAAESVAWFAHLGGFAAGCAVALPVAIHGWMTARSARLSATRKRPATRRPRRAA